jgi:hypothetical protein
MIRALALVVMLFLAVPSPSAAQQAEDGSSANGQFKDFAELTAGTTAREGFFDTYEKAGALYMAIPVDRLDEEFLAAFEIAQGIGSSLLFGGLMLGIFGGDGIVALERHGDQVYLLRRPVRYVATSGSPEEAAVRLTYGSSVLASAKIESIRQDSALVIDIHDWIVSDLSDIGQMVRSAVSRQPGQPGSASFDGSRSYLESVKGFPDNVNFRAKLTFKTTRPANRRTVPDQRYLPVSMHTTFARLPEVPMTPRLADDRMGYFTTVQKNFSRDDTTFFVRYVNRWRLERGERVGDLYRPTEPIVYYLDRTIPDEYRPYVADGVERWNKAFEAAGWKDAIRAEPLPDDADPEDIRYATIRWNVSDEAGYGAIGPSTADPRTGEILDADILIEANMVLGFKSAWRNLASPADVFEGALTAGEADLASAAAGGELSTFGAQMAGQGALLRAVLAARGEIEPGASLPDEYVGQAMLWVTMHEVGHTLGLRHNFGSSRDTPLDELYDPAWAEENGVTGSVMDYHAPNLAPDGAMIDYYYSPVVGSYDDWIISYGYTADPTRAEELARQAGRRGHAYGTDFDAYGPGALDPTVNTFDLSADPLSWGKQRTSLIDAVWSELPGRVLGDNASYSDLTNAYTSLLGQYATAMAPAIKYIGGQFYYNTHVGDEYDVGPFASVPVAKQQDALDFITKTAFAEDAFEVPREVFAQFGARRWSDWGSSTTFNGRIDYPFYEQVLSIQTRMLAQLTNPYRMARIRDSELKYGTDNVVTIPELFESLTEAVWSEVWTAPGRNIAPSRRDLQRAYLDRMTEILLDPPDRMPADARAVARVRLADLQERLTRRLSPPFNFDDYSYAHLSEIKEIITQVLEAGIKVELD